MSLFHYIICSYFWLLVSALPPPPGGNSNFQSFSGPIQRLPTGMSPKTIPPPLRMELTEIRLVQKNFSQRYIDLNNEYCFRGQKGALIKRDYPLGHKPYSRAEDYQIDMILNVSHVARRINDLAETQGDQENFYKILSWEFAQNEADPGLLNVFNDVGLQQFGHNETGNDPGNGMGSASRLIQLKQIGLTTRFQSFDWSTVPREDADALSTYFKDISTLYFSRLLAFSSYLKAKYRSVGKHAEWDGLFCTLILDFQVAMAVLEHARKEGKFFNPRMLDISDCSNSGFMNFNPEHWVKRDVWLSK